MLACCLQKQDLRSQVKCESRASADPEKEPNLQEVQWNPSPMEPEGIDEDAAGQF